MLPLQTGDLFLLCATEAMMSDADCLGCSVLHGTTNLVLACQVRHTLLKADSDGWRLRVKILLD